MSSLDISPRASGVSFAVSGLIVAVVLPWHPSIFGNPLEEVITGFEPWSVLHASLLVMLPLTLIGAAGMVAAHRGRLGRLGRAGLIGVFLGVIGGTVTFGVEAIAFPALAERSPELLTPDGHLSTLWLIIAASVLTISWPLGVGILGVAAARAGLFPPAPGVALAIGAVAFMVLAVPFVPIAGQVSEVAFGGAQVWWGWLIWRSDRTPEPPRD